MLRKNLQNWTPRWSTAVERKHTEKRRLSHLKDHIFIDQCGWYCPPVTSSLVCSCLFSPLIWTLQGLYFSVGRFSWWRVEVYDFGAESQNLKIMFSFNCSLPLPQIYEVGPLDTSCCPCISKTLLVVWIDDICFVYWEHRWCVLSFWKEISNL